MRRRSSLQLRPVGPYCRVMGLWQCVLLGGAGGALVEVLDVLAYVRAWQRARRTPTGRIKPSPPTVRALSMCRPMCGCWSSGFRWARARRGCSPPQGRSAARARHSPLGSPLRRCLPRSGDFRATSRRRRQTRRRRFCHSPRLRPGLKAAVPRGSSSRDTAIGSPPRMAHGAWAHPRLPGDTGHDRLHIDSPGARRTRRHSTSRTHERAKRASVCRWPRDQARSSRQVRTTATGKAKAPYSPSWTAYTAFRHDGSRSHHCHSGYCDPVRDRTVCRPAGRWAEYSWGQRSLPSSWLP